MCVCVEGGSCKMVMRDFQRWPAWLYVPNIVGYVRIVFTIIAFYDWRTPGHFFWYYYFGFALDAVDGLAARVLKQSSEFGAQLDMLTDRCATGALLTLLSTLYSKYAPLLVSLIFLDGFSHWMQMVAGVCAGSSSHKTAGRGKLLNFYYWRPVLTVVCSLNEMCFLMLYVKAFTRGPMLFGSNIAAADVMLICAAPVCVLKQVVSVIQVLSAHYTIVDALDRRAHDDAMSS